MGGTRERPVVVVAGLGDTGVLVATRLTRSADVIAVATRPGLVSGQELGARLVDPERWRRNYVVPYSRFRKLDRARIVHGRIASVDIDGATVRIERSDGTNEDVHYDALVIATGVSNGFWRTDAVEDLATNEGRIADALRSLDDARTIAIVGGGATGVSVADNLARLGRAEVHLFVAGDEPLPGHHPNARRWIRRQLQDDGVIVHTGHRAVLPGGIAPDRITHEPVEWTTGQPPFVADAVLWAVGAARPNTDFLPGELLDDEGFVRVDDTLRVPGRPRVFAIGDVAATDPLRSSARNWGHRIVVANVRATLRGRPVRRRFDAPAHRWGSVIGLQPEGLTVTQANGKRFRVPRRLAEPLLYGIFVTRGLYGGLRRER